jgi:hypothetical protein
METTETTTENQKTEKTKDRSASYPALTLDEAITFANKVYSKFTSVSVTRDEYGTAFNVNANSVSRHFGACNQFGLLEKNNDGYKITQLFDRIQNPENENEKKIARLEAFGSPKIYKELIEKFDGKFVPPELPNTLVKHHGITLKASPEAADTFIQSAQQSGAMNEARVLKFKDTLSATQKMNGYAEIISESSGKSDEKNPPVKVIQAESGAPLNDLKESYKKVPIYLTKDKVAYFAYPSDMSANDVKLVEHNIQGILLRINLENEETKNPS